MKTRPYLLLRLQERSLRLEDVEVALANEVHREMQPDGRIRVWGWVPRLDKYLRVVLLEDGETVLNAMPDRNFTRHRGQP